MIPLAWLRPARSGARRLYAVAWFLSGLSLAACQATVAPPPPPRPAKPVADLPPAQLVRPPQATLPPTIEVAPAPALGARPAAVSPAPLVLPPESVRIGLVLPLSGRGAELGRALFDAAMLALFEVGGERLILLPRDSASTAEGAAEAVRAAVDGGARFLLGPLFRDEVEAGAAVTRASGLTLIGFSSDRAVASSDVFLLGFTPEAQVARVVRYALGRGLKSFSALVPRNAYGDAMLAALERELAAGGGTLLAVEHYQADGSDADRAVRQLAHTAEGMQALFLPEGGAVLRQMAPLLPHYNIHPGKVRFIGTGLWEDATLGREPAMLGAWFAGPVPGAAEAFVARFQAAYGRKPHRLAGLGYDAVALAALLVQSGEAGFADRRQLLNPSGFEGTDGLFRFLADGTAERGLAVMEIRANGLNLIDAAPQSFELASQ